MPQCFLSAINLNEKPQLTAINRVVNCQGYHDHRLPDHWILHLYSYEAEMIFNGVPLAIYPGCLTLVPPGARVEYNLKTDGLHFYAHFTLPRPAQENPVHLPVQFDVRGDLYRFEQTILAIGRSFIYRENRLHAEIKLWDLLWELVNCGGTSVARRHPSLEKALQLIDLRLSEEISVSALAHEVGISRNHLTRLFQTEKEMTVVGYVRQQRAHRAKHLLETTPMSIGDIASQVHSPNLQSFSALVKQETGHPPTFWRKAKASSE